jgi:hypothetical protein
LTGDTARNRLTFEAGLDGQRGALQTLPMDSGLGPALAQHMGLDPGVLPISPANVSAPTLKAREARIALHGEQLEVYQVTVTEGTAPMIDFYVTQLGQVILAKTNFGYSLTSEGW